MTSIMTNQISSLEGRDEELSGIGFSSVVDAVIQLRFVETDHEITRQMLIVKSRGSDHSNQRHAFVITNRGLQFPALLPPPSAPARSPGRKGGGK
jgi:circadian clock protein KaiC